MGRKTTVTANLIASIVIPILALCLILWVLIALRAARRNEPPQVHRPHAPGAGYDLGAMARSKGSGMADGGM